MSGAASTDDERPQRRRPTIREVARLAGVSHQTVSRYLKLDDTVNEAMRERIGQAIAQLDYRPNLVARAMRSSRTGRLALLLPPGTTPSSLEVFTGATATAHEAGYVLEVVILDGSTATRMDRVLELADSGFFEGIVALTPLPLDPRRPTVGSTPIVVAPHYDDQMRSIGELADAAAAEELISRLAEQGHRRFLHLAGDYVHTSARQRRDVYLATVERLGLESQGVVDCDWHAGRARQAILDLPADGRVTAVIAASDVLAVGAVSGAQLRGWKVPDDLSVTGWDDNPAAAAMIPSLTTVDVEHERLGRRVMTQLLAVVRGGTPAEERQSLTRIVWRESTGPAPGAAGGPTGTTTATEATTAVTTAVDATDGGPEPLVCQVDVPPGNYDVTVELGDADVAASTAVTVEARRTMLAETATAAGHRVRRTFAVNVRDPKGQPTKVGVGSPGLTVAFTGAAPRARLVEVRPIPAARPGRPALVLAGDSTVCDQDSHPFTGWGQIIPRYLRPGIVVANYADSGRGSATFMDDPRLFEAMLTVVLPGDLVLIQFGHNDKTTTAADYRANLTTMINEVRGRGGRPVLVSPPVRRGFGDDGRLTPTARHVNALGVDLPAELRRLAADREVPLVDLTAASAALVEELGAEAAKAIYLTTERGDDTHFSEYGADRICRLVVDRLDEVAGEAITVLPGNEMDGVRGHGHTRRM